MKIKLLFFSFLFFAYVSALGQNWYPLQNGVNNSDNGGVSLLFSFNQKLFVSGKFTTVDNFPISSSLVYWNGKRWRALDTEIFDTEKINKFVTFHDTLYAIGRSSVLDETLNLLKYNEANDEWTIVPNSLIKQSPNDGITTWAHVFGAIEYNNELYLVGYFDNVGNTPVRNIAKWNGSNWTTVLDSNSSVINSQILYDIIPYKGDLIISGKIDSINGKVYNNLARWNGVKWDNLDDGLTSSTVFNIQIVTKLTEFNGELYAGGLPVITSESVIPYTLSKYNGSSWQGVEGFEYDSTGILSNKISDLHIFGNNLFISKGNSGQIYVYNNSRVFELEHTLNGKVLSLEVFNDQLYAGGHFQEEGSPNGVAKLGILSNEINVNIEVYVYPNPTSGNFLVDYKLHDNSKFLIKIYTQNGKLVFQKKYDDLEGKYLRQFNLSKFPKGFYIINVLSKNFEQSIPLILN